ncbi:Fe/S biogenesis protein NfuA [Kordia antarctica]|uniref:Fe/S biogenesis protein NfuA n=1 Tax=Kordia antarctica TaxID=1218801 RepID=A0A7L4ZN91_9FLAO|nr:NifU family protein [Kordia antarctica]QHI38198.1 Fe/S biogenesis protein NfuA [Kordia antarctica]
MSGITISIEKTSNPAIIKFEASSFLTRHNSYEFKNIDDAKDSLLAQQLFYLPFVKTIFISGNFIAIERYNIVEWSDVQDEVAEQIQTYINEGKEVISETATPKKVVPVTIYAESTPNPTVMKFVANKKIIDRMLEFKSIDETKYAPLAQALFHFPFIKEVFLDKNYISITKYDMVEWNDITMEIREFIRNYIQEGKEVISEDIPVEQKEKIELSEESFEALDDISKEIVNILDEYIKPAVASDGGNIMFDSYDPVSKVVKVVLQGACSGCPSSTMTLKSGIENTLKSLLKGHVNEVVAING